MTPPGEGRDLAPAGKERAFREPWEAKAFALVVHLHERGLFSWAEWSGTLGAVIAEDAGRSPPESYYRLWLTALERIVAKNDFLSEAELAATRAAWRAAAARTPHGRPIELP